MSYEIPVFTDVKRTLGVPEIYLGNLLTINDLVDTLKKFWKKLNNEPITDAELDSIIRRYYTEPILKVLLRHVHGEKPQDALDTISYFFSSNEFVTTQTGGRKVVINISSVITVKGNHFKNPLFYLLKEFIEQKYSKMREIDESAVIRIAIKSIGAVKDSKVDLTHKGDNYPKGLNGEEPREIGYESATLTDNGVPARNVIAQIPIASLRFPVGTNFVELSPEDQERLKDFPVDIFLEKFNPDYPRVTGAAQSFLTVYWEAGGPDLREIMDEFFVRINPNYNGDRVELAILFFKTYLNSHPFFKDILSNERLDSFQKVLEVFKRAAVEFYRSLERDIYSFSFGRNDSIQNISFGGRQDPDEFEPCVKDLHNQNKLPAIFADRIKYLMSVAIKMLPEELSKIVVEQLYQLFKKMPAFNGMPDDEDLLQSMYFLGFRYLVSEEGEEESLMSEIKELLGGKNQFDFATENKVIVEKLINTLRAIMSVRKFMGNQLEIVIS